MSFNLRNWNISTQNHCPLQDNNQTQNARNERFTNMLKVHVFSRETSRQKNTQHVNCLFHQENSQITTLKEMQREKASIITLNPPWPSTTPEVTHKNMFKYDSIKSNPSRVRAVILLHGLKKAKHRKKT